MSVPRGTGPAGGQDHELEKSAIRAEARARLGAMDPEERDRLARRIETVVWMVPEVAAARSILLFASMPSEVPTDSLAIEARRRGIRVVYPRCLVETGMMTLHEVETSDHLVEGGRFGIREPGADCPITDLDRIDVAFVPGLAWDGAGGRLGRGGGYYDRLFADHRDTGPIRVGIFFGIQRVPAVPVDHWDVSLDIVVTEEGAHRLR